jgi:phosphatidylglycerol:prolipoprotein diacylglycerol transferase
MHPTLFTIGNWSISTYTVLLDLGLILGLVLAYREGQRLYAAGERAFDLSLWAIVGGVLGGRVGYVVVNWSAFAEDWVSVLYLWRGGLSFHGAFLGGLLFMGLFSAILPRTGKPLSFWALADAITPGLALGIAFGWAACLMAGCAYGTVGEGWAHALLPDIYGIEAYRVATQAIGLGFALLLFAGVWLLRGNWPVVGAGFLMYSLLYFAGHFFLEFTRGDEAVYLGPWRLAQLFDVVLVLAAAAGLLRLWQQARQVADELPGEGPAIGEAPGEALVAGEETAPDASTSERPAGEGSDAGKLTAEPPDGPTE